jgi:hypothetical protein
MRFTKGLPYMVVLNTSIFESNQVKCYTLTNFENDIYNAVTSEISRAYLGKQVLSLINDYFKRRKDGQKKQ